MYACMYVCFDFVFDFMFRPTRLYVSTISTLCFDFEFDYRAFSTTDFWSNSDMCSTRLGRNLNRKPRPGFTKEEPAT